MAKYKEDAEFFILYIGKEAANLHKDSIKEKIDMAYDWYRIESGLWILYSSKTARQWYTILKKIIDDEYMFVSRLDMSDRQGWMKKAFWDWVKEKNKPE